MGVYYVLFNFDQKEAQVLYKIGESWDGSWSYLVECLQRLPPLPRPQAVRSITQKAG
jgi:hypothetical protein